MIHVNRGGTSLGVFPEEEVRKGLRTLRFAPSDFGWREGMATWQPLSQFPELAALGAQSSRPPPPPPPLPPRPGETSSAVPAATSPPHRGGWAIRITRDYLLPRGRIGRAQFIVRSALIWTGWGVLMFVIVSPLAFGLTSERTVIAGVTVTVAIVGWVLAVLLFFWGMSMQAAKRLHDFNRSGGWVFVALLMASWAGRIARTPIRGPPSDADVALGALGIFGLLICGLILLFVRGSKGANRFGAPPVEKKGTRVAATAVVCAYLIAGFVWLLMLAFTGGVISGTKSGGDEGKPDRDPDVIKGAQALVRKDGSTAVEAFTNASRKFPRNDIIFLGLGRGYGILRDDDRARQNYERAVELNPRNAEAWTHLGATLNEREPSKAVEACKKATELQPGNATAWFILGLTYESQKNFSLAIPALERAAQVKPNFTEAWSTLADAYSVTGDYKRSSDARQRAEDLKARNGPANLKNGDQLPPPRSP
jgi:uncharacterized membrane protein YhaH (DUF805 family)